MQIILASQSPRRKELMGLFHIPFSIQVADIDETMDATLPPAEEVARVSRLKAEAIPRNPDDIVIAADTIVVCDGKVLGKPAGEEHARQMLHMLSGRKHQVMTGMTVLCGSRAEVCTEISDVYFRNLTDSEINRYIRTGEPMDKAGAYGIQGGAALFVENIHGDYFNIVGLPVCKLSRILAALLPDFMEESK